ncbi:hypothetical protein I3842_14G077800 [Carya illinoinensis]|uniref:RNase H type-1 domain-containing protein n=1 Tax=Carya illinoinensis TaxID=32201 RepID=A0A922D9R0_CARIL|nr:hypothetical protein I3842_14G077800 [Carya illinoinensis]
MELQCICSLAYKEYILSWKSPPIDYVKLNFDGALFRKMGAAGVGIILRDEKGAVLFASNRKEMVDIIHAGRQGNDTAHLLAQHAKWIEDSCQWLHSYLDFLSNRVLID